MHRLRLGQILALIPGLALTLIAATATTRAAEIKVLSTGAMKAVVAEVAADFESKSGHKIQIASDTAGGLFKRIGGGEDADVAVITPKFIDELIAKGRMAAGSRANVARVGMGVAVKTGGAAPTIATVDDFKRALVAARSVGYVDPKSGASSGIYFDGLLEKLGIAGEVRPKAKLKQGGYAAELLLTGEADLVVHQISEIVPVKGVILVGPLPKDVQNYTVYAVGLSAGTRNAEVARAFIAMLLGPGTEPVLRQRGMERP